MIYYKTLAFCLLQWQFSFQSSLLLHMQLTSTFPVEEVYGIMMPMAT
jgi:hypothetical protein